METVRKSSVKHLILRLSSLLQATFGCLPINEFALNQDVTVTNRIYNPINNYFRGPNMHRQTTINHRLNHDYSHHYNYKKIHLCVSFFSQKIFRSGQRVSKCKLW